MRKISNGLKLIVGLGNPGKKYAITRHNAGFQILDALAKKMGVEFEFKKKLNSEICAPSLLLRRKQSESRPTSSGQRDGWGEFKILLAKPQTFMNESGTAVSKLLATYGLRLPNLLIVHDEIDLPFGEMRLSQGGAAGHKGAQSVIAAVGNAVSRLRVGVENRKEYRVPPTNDYVLQRFTKEEMLELKAEIIPAAIFEIRKWLQNHK